MEHQRKVLLSIFVLHILFAVGLYHYWDPMWLLLSVVGNIVFGSMAFEGYLHRYIAHQSFSMSKPMEVLMHFLSIFCVQGSTIQWASNHNTHHIYSDTDKDPHPGKDGIKTWLWLPVLYSKTDVKPHIGTIKRLMRNKIITFTDTYYFQIYWGLLLLFALVSVKFTIYFFVVSAVYIFHTSGLTNVASHTSGTKVYDTGDNSGNTWYLAFIIGSPFHNTHHAFPGYYTCSTKWYQIDPTGLCIKYIMANKPVKEIPK